MSVDPTVHALAKSFLDDATGVETTEEHVDELAQMIQKCIEDYLSYLESDA